MGLDTHTTLGSAIRASRKTRSVTLRKFAQQMGISASLLSLIEQDAHHPTTELVQRMARSLGADADHWCSLIGKLAPDTEERLAKLAKKDPKFFRTLIGRATGGL